MTLSIIAVIGGLILLVWGADRFVDGAAATARNLGVSPLLIGLTIVGLGTSAPEIMVSIFAATDGNPGLAIGNAVGSNIANIALILGATALLTPIVVQSGTLKREYPIVLLVTFLAYGLVWDKELGQTDGIILLAALAAFLLLTVYLARRPHEADPLEAEIEAEVPDEMPMGKAIFWLVVGLIILLGSSKALVWGAVNIALALGVSDLVIGLTIVAIGTSLPELAASIASTMKNEHDLAVGNIIGSNIFNLLAVMSVPGLLAPGAVPEDALYRDFPLMTGLTIALLFIAWGFKGPGRINRFEGGLLLATFVGYQYLLFISA